MSSSTMTRERVAMRKLVWVGPLTIVVVALANLIIRTIAVAFFGVSNGFQFFQAPAVIGSTIIYLVLALLAFMLVGRFARRPINFYRWLALVALVISLLAPIMALTGQMPIPGMNINIFWTMITMHIVSAVITVGLLTTLAHKQE